MKAQADEESARPAYDGDGDGVVDATCEGGKRNGFYGYGIVDALKAVKKRVPGRSPVRWTAPPPRPARRWRPRSR